MSEKQIKVWFQNRRMKVKKEEKVGPKKSLLKSIDASKSDQSTSAQSTSSSEIILKPSIADNSTLIWTTIPKMAENIDPLYVHPSEVSPNNDLIGNYEILDTGYKDVQNYPVLIDESNQQPQSYNMSHNNNIFYSSQMSGHQQLAINTGHSIAARSQSSNNYLRCNYPLIHVQDGIDLQDANSYAQKLNGYASYDSANCPSNQNALPPFDSIYDLYSSENYMQL